MLTGIRVVLTGRITGVAVQLMLPFITAFGYFCTLAVYMGRVIWRCHEGKMCPKPMELLVLAMSRCLCSPRALVQKHEK